MTQDNSSQSSHEPTKPLVISSFTMSYNIVFNIGHFVNPILAARLLLKEDFTVAFSNPLTNTTELPKRYERLLKIRKQAEQGREFTAITEDLKLISLLRWVAKNPKFSFFLLKAYMTREHKNPDETEKSGDGVKHTFEDVLDDVDARLVKSQLLSQLHIADDESSFSPFYREQAPFTRVELQPLIAWINGTRQAIDVELLIHRSGNAIITFHLTFDDDKTVDEVISLQSMKDLIITRYEIPCSLARFWGQAEGLSVRKISEIASAYYRANDIDWWAFYNREDTFVNLFEIYRLAITSVLLDKKPTKPHHPYSWLRSGNWFAYPVVHIRKTSSDCLHSSEFKKAHEEELSSLNLKVKLLRKIKDEVTKDIIKSDLSLFEAESFFLSASNATAVYHKSVLLDFIKLYGSEDKIPGQEWLARYFPKNTLIETLLLQKWILHVIDSELTSFPHSLSKLNGLRRDLLIGLDEYHGLTLGYDSGESILEAGREKLRLNRLYSAVQVKLTGLQGFIEVAESRRRSRRDYLLRLVTILITPFAT